MASIRKVKKSLKRELKKLRNRHVFIEDSIKGDAVMVETQWLILSCEIRLSNIETRRRFKALKNRTERKIKKNGKWKAYSIYKAYTKAKLNSINLFAKTQVENEKDETLYSQSDFLKDFDPTKHNAMSCSNTLNNDKHPKDQETAKKADTRSL